MTKSAQSLYGAVKGVEYGVSYNFGTVAIGFDKYKTENNLADTAVNNALGETTTNGVLVTKKYGATYAVDSNMTLGIVKSVTDASGAATNGLTETVTALQLGYNFGPVAFSGTVSKFTNLNDLTTGPQDQVNGRMAQVRVTTKF
jgi:hypothetical protein